MVNKVGPLGVLVCRSDSIPAVTCALEKMKSMNSEERREKRRECEKSG